MILSFIKNIGRSVDWLMFGAIVFISIAGILTMNSFARRMVFLEADNLAQCFKYRFVCGEYY